MILSDREIRSRLTAGDLHIEPLDWNEIQPASIDIRLHPTLRIFSALPGQDINPAHPEATAPTIERFIPPNGTFRLMPGQFILGSTIEQVVIPHDTVGRIEGKSSLGRLGLLIHATAGYVDPGFEGNLTLEISNGSSNPILLSPGMRIAQLALLQATSPAERPYGSSELRSRYQGQKGATPSRSTPRRPAMPPARNHQLGA